MHFTAAPHKLRMDGERVIVDAARQKQITQSTSEVLAFTASAVNCLLQVRALLGPKDAARLNASPDCLGFLPSGRLEMCDVFVPTDVGSSGYRLSCRRTELYPRRRRQGSALGGNPGLAEKNAHHEPFRHRPQSGAR